MRKLTTILILSAVLGSSACSPPTSRIDFECGEGGIARIQYHEQETAKLQFAGTTHMLVRERTASGAKYASEGISFWSKGDEAMIEMGGQSYRCTRNS